MDASVVLTGEGTKKMTKMLQDDMTEKEVQEFLDSICAKFNILAKCYGVDGLNDVSYLEIHGVYDDNFHLRLK